MTSENTRHIQVLPPSVVEKIAAGEVVERPASVVKELVENSLDAGATRIEIQIEDAGFSLIKISDNGHGMGSEDLQKSLLPHATSKIEDADDLFAIASMGFRGEALASISAVSRVTITTSDTNHGEGYSLSSEGGTLSEIIPVQQTRGTTITCKDLFFNVPARKKFMKSRRAERMAITRMLEQLVIPFPAVHFTYYAEGKSVLDVPEVASPHERIAQITGTEFAKKLIRCSGENGDMSATIYISDPQEARPRPPYQSLYVNLRSVENDSVLYAIREAFSRFIASNLRPCWFCILDVDPAKVDVNIHPTKQKIKFDDERGLFSFIYKSVHGSIAGAIDIAPELVTEEESESPSGNDESSATSLYQKQQASAASVQEESEKGLNLFGNISASKHKTKSVDQHEAEQTALSFMALAKEQKSGLSELEQNHDDPLPTPNEGWALLPCYQIHRMYILAPIKQGIVIIDQHAAHERILYEEALEDLKKGKSESQRLLFPIIFDMIPVEKEVLLASRDYFNTLGFDVQDFGGKSVAVSSMPATGFLTSSTIEEAIREMVTSLLEEKDKELLSNPEKRFAASFACGAAIKFGKELKKEEMHTLINSLFAAQNPYICPHGRPTLIRITLDELTRRFLRS